MELGGIRCYLQVLLLLVRFTSLTSGYEKDVDKRFLLSNYHWGSWSRPSTRCTTTDCLKGSMERHRSCYVDKTNAHVDTRHCDGSDIELSLCSATDCGNITSSHVVNGHWSTWSNYSACSHTCGHGLRYRRRTCNNPAPSGGGEHCHGASVHYTSCTHTNACPSTACSDTSSSCRRSYCTGVNGNFSLHYCRKTCGFCNSTMVTTTAGTVVNGNWGSWGSPSACSASCGTGFSTRHRLCNNPAPSGGGQPCHGSSSWHTYCTHHCAPAWSSWLHWSTCSTSCNMGVITRHRTCNQYGYSDSCHGNSTETHECSTGPCAEWSHWFEGDCSVSCGNGTMERLRHCSTGRPTDCSGNDYETVPFLVQVLALVDISLTEAHSGPDEKRFILEFIQYTWGPWSAYHGCLNPNCELHVKERNRTCYANSRTVVDESNCNGISADLGRCTQSDCSPQIVASCTDSSSQCNAVYCNQPWGDTYCRKTCGHCTTSYPTPPMVVDGGWSNWGLTTPCSVSCGTGQMNRYRVCDNPSPSSSGRPCPGESKQYFPCYQPACVIAVQGQWGAWGSYSPCSASCGTGLETRLRRCDSPAPSGGGNPCIGSPAETFPCVIKPCSVNGQWGVWAQWSSCSVTCGVGTLTRSRRCDDPAPVGNGANCVGNGTELHECSSGPCAEWTHWFDGPCSVSCGSGTSERLRHCSTGRDKDCPGQAYELVPCNNPICV